MSQTTDNDPNSLPPLKAATLPIQAPNGRIITPTEDPDVKFCREMIQHHLAIVAAYERRAGIKTTTKDMRAWYKRQMG